MNMSFSLTEPQFLDGTKNVTRRLGWRKLKPGTILTAVRKGMGLKKGEHPVVLGKLCVKSVTQEALHVLMENLEYGESEVRREGFAHDNEVQGCPTLFVQMFCKHMKCTPDTIVTRIEFRKLDEQNVD